MYVCVCLAVTDSQIRQAIEDGAHSLTDLRRIFGITLECGRCTDLARQLLKAGHEAAHGAPPVDTKKRAAGTDPG